MATFQVPDSVEPLVQQFEAGLISVTELALMLLGDHHITIRSIHQNVFTKTLVLDLVRDCKVNVSPLDIDIEEAAIVTKIAM